MAGIEARAIVAAAWVMAWSLPSARLSVLPSERALALAADAICWAEGSTARTSLPAPSGSDAAGADPRLVEMTTLFEPLAGRQRGADLARVGFAALTSALLLARLRFAPSLVIAAAILYLGSQPVNWDANRLVVVAESPRLWWLAVSQWSPTLWAERLAALATVWLSLLGAAALLLAGTLRHRCSGLAQPTKAACIVDGRRAQPTL